MSASATTYDEVPYLSKPLFATHPDLLAAAGRLRGLNSPPASACRVLELGCAAGGNIIPMACTLPGSQFLGIDLSEVQVAEGREICRQLALPNIELKALSIADLDSSYGNFDYIICHGVFSWVPPLIQEKILWVCRNLLSPTGIAYISYNTYPGWHHRKIVRDLMKYHAARFDDPAVKVQQARAIVSFMANASASQNSNLSRVLAEEAKDLEEAADYYLFHEHLEDHNQPLYFHEFVAKSRAAGMDYLGEAWHHTQTDTLPAEVQEQLQAISSDLIDLEQFVDFITSRTFRRTLLCRAECEVLHTPPPSVMNSLYFSALARPQAAQPDVHSEVPERFLIEGSGVTTNVPLCKATLMALFERWPKAMSFDDLVVAVKQMLDLTPGAVESMRPRLASFLMKGYVSHFVAVHSEPFKLTTELSERPRASKLARLLAKNQSRVPNLRHRLIVLSPLARVAALLADGSRTIGQIAREAKLLAPDLMSQEVASTDPVAIEDAAIQRALLELARSAVLEA